MADVKSVKSKEMNSEIELNEVFLDSRRIRYLYLYHSNVISTHLMEGKQCVPLFLGCDVLHECGITSGNLPRYHAKQAKRGLATKLNFSPEVRVVGIHGSSRGVWFYSVQGLFKVAFDIYSREEQNGCLQSLVDVWKRQLFDPVLTSEIHVEWNNSLEEVLSTSLADSASTGGALDEVRSNIVDDFKLAVSALICEGKEIMHQKLDVVKAYLLFMSQERNPDSFQSNFMSVVEKGLKLLALASTSNRAINNSNSSKAFSPVNDDGESQCSWDSNVLGTTSKDNNLVRDERLGLGNFPRSSAKEFVGSSSCREAILLEVARWLGTEFSLYHGSISERVIKFKQRNISSIGNLPSAISLIEEVFPLSMQVFFCSWFQIPLSEEGLHIPSSDRKHKLLPLIQLILELANQNLISGMAHVLFSQLIQSDNVQ